MAAQATLTRLAMVRIHAGQPFGSGPPGLRSWQAILAGVECPEIVEGLCLGIYQPLPELTMAFQRERQLKRWSRPKKEALIRGGFDQRRKLSRSHD
jgi:hypothetical protein